MCNPDYDPNARNPTPMKRFSQSTLRADVTRAGEVFDPGSLTCIILAGSSAPWFMVNHEFTSKCFYGKMMLPGGTGGKNTSSVTPFSVVPSPKNKIR